MIPTTAHVWDALAGRQLYQPLVARAQDLVNSARAFHWPLEFSDVIARGGFDVVLGNPLSFPKIISARSGDAIRTRLARLR